MNSMPFLARKARLACESCNFIAQLLQRVCACLKCGSLQQLCRPASSSACRQARLGHPAWRHAKPVHAFGGHCAA